MKILVDLSFFNIFVKLYRTFWCMILDSEIETLAFHLSDGDDTDNSGDGIIWRKERRLQLIKTSFKEKSGLFRATILEKRFSSNTATIEQVDSFRYSSPVVYFLSMIFYSKISIVIQRSVFRTQLNSRMELSAKTVNALNVNYYLKKYNPNCLTRFRILLKLKID